MPFRTPSRIAPIIIALSLVVLAGCPKKDSSGSSDSSGSGKSSDPSKPMAGRAPTKTSQFKGVWLATTPGDHIGLEFLSDNKCLVSDVVTASLAGGTGSGQMATYDLIDGGRISFVFPTGLTKVYGITVNGDELELKGNQALSLGGSGDFQRFRRLKPGQTLMDGMKEQEAIEAKQQQQRSEGVDEFLKRPGLVLTVTQPGEGAPAPIALDPGPVNGGNFSGKGWYDERPPHLDAIAGQVSTDKNNGTVSLAVRFGPRMQPPAAQQSQGGQITLDVTGDPKDLHVTGKVNYGGHPYEMVLKSDPALHDQIVKHFNDEIARTESLKKPLVDALKDYAVLNGTSGSPYPNQPKPNADQLILFRDPAVKNPGIWRVEGSSLNGQTNASEPITNAAAAIVIANDKPLLRVVSQTREYILQPSGNGQLAGHWRSPSNPNGQPAQFTVTQALTSQERDQVFAEQRKALTQIPADTIFAGMSFEDSPLGLSLPIPVSLRLIPSASGAFTGTATYPSMQCVLNMAGQVQDTPMGPRLLLKYTGIEKNAGNNSEFFAKNVAESGSWSLGATDATARKLAGQWQRPNSHRPVTLDRATDEWRNQLRTKLAETLAKSGEFYLARPADPAHEPTVLDFSIDPAANKVTAKILSGGYMIGAKAGLTTFDGDIKDQDGFLTLDITGKSTAKNVTWIRKPILVVYEDGGTIHLNGLNLDLGRDGKGNSINPQLLEFVPLSTMDSQAQAAVTKAIAANQPK